MLVFKLVLFGAFATAFATPNDTEHRNSCPPGFFKTPRFCMGLMNDQCKYYGGVSYQNLCVIQKTVLPQPLANQRTPKNLIVWENNSNGFRRLNYSENLHLQSTCGVANFMTERISDGVIASPGQFPWSLKLYSTDSDCSATLISSRHVLTAKHCFNTCINYKSPIKLGKVGYGGICEKNGPNCPNGGELKTVNIRRVVFPDKLTYSCILDTDFALLELENDIPSDDKTNPICVGNLEIQNIINIQQSGYGMTHSNEHLASDIMHYMHAKILEKVNDFSIIARGLKATNDSLLISKTLPGDSGGGMQGTYKGSDRSYLIGVLSGTIVSKPSDNVVIFVPYLVDWICQQTGVCQL